MKAFIGYALVVAGLPHAVGLLAGLPFARLFVGKAPPGGMYRRFAIVDLINGLGCLAAALLLFWLLGLEMTLTLPVVLGIRSAVYFFPKQQFLMGICHLAGIFGGWTVYRCFLAPV